MSFFDECFRTYALLTEKPKKWKSFWEREIENLKKIPFDITKKEKTHSNTETIVIEYSSAGRIRIKANLVLPPKKQKPPVIVLFHDYFSENRIYQSLTSAGFAQLSIRMRGHENFNRLQKEESATEETKSKSFGYFSENLLYPDNYYMKNLYLDAYRTLEVLRLQKNIDSSNIGIWGTGIGAAMGVFAACFMKRCSALFLENPGFSLLSLTQNLSKSEYSREINAFIRSKQANRNIIKENLNLLDSMYFADDLNIPVYMALNLENKENAPQGGFALFHRVPSDKEMFIFSDIENNSLADTQKIIIENAKEFFNKNLLQQ